jgi:2-dehydro-3-deoxy-D-arabinonate dehydratase
MKLGQIRRGNRVMAAVFENNSVHPIHDYSLLSLLQKAESESVDLAGIARELAGNDVEESKPVIPVHPPEVWACGCAYKVSAEWRDAEHGAREGFYAAVYKDKRPELFFKGTARVCSGPDGPIGIRSDSQFTAPEAELAAVIASDGKIFGYTIGNDVSAWDIERANPLYLPQSKIFDACVALGPVMVTADEITNPYNLEMECRIERDGQVIFEGSSTTQNLFRKIEQMVEFLLRSNSVPTGTVMMTGTGIIVPAEAALKPEDRVIISIPEIGTLSNIARTV